MSLTQKLCQFVSILQPRLELYPGSWYGKPVMHSPKVWPWWKVFATDSVSVNGYAPSSKNYIGRNLWIYTRKTQFAFSFATQIRLFNEL